MSNSICSKVLTIYWLRNGRICYRYFTSEVWQFPSKEEEQLTFRTIPREHWLIGSVHGTPKLTIKKLRPTGFARPAQFITTGLNSLMVLLMQR